MMKMLIQIDEEKVLTDRKYNLEKMWNAIDKMFSRDCIKEKQLDGSILYSGHPQRDYYTRINLAVMSLQQQRWFAKYCIQWIWYDNDDDETLPFQNIDVLSRLRKECPLFAV